MQLKINQLEALSDLDLILEDAHQRADCASEGHDALKMRAANAFVLRREGSIRTSSTKLL
jgi:hypothetical protein